MTDTSLAGRLKEYQSAVDTALDQWLPPENKEPEHLHQAMRYAVLSEGKRIRPVLVFAAGEAAGVELPHLTGPACAVEMIHAYSLIHDDLPAMDDDDLRRGRPTCHRKFDEATAILAGDALQALAFQVLAQDRTIKVDAEQRIEMINRLALASGSEGMAGGQAIDLDSVGKAISLAELEKMHLYKTGALIRASVELGGLSSTVISREQMQSLGNYAHCIGLAFQVQDDILDIESDTETLGKPQGSDAARNKPTYPNLLGMEEAKKTAHELLRKAIASLECFDARADTLRAIAEYIVSRNK
ncbi:MAG: (2E,6E)-farnesyl diphosphate synthase [Gammaproteobacteria bacterium]|nr:(2E,6E)-farnesyl diphosphate synthase [Gammaproteobacteria bacterium]